MYDVRSMKAEDFIDDGEIRETLDYADQNKDNVELIDSIIEKAKLRKGLTHREASVLLACEMPDKINEIYDLAEQIKKDFYGNRIVMYSQKEAHPGRGETGGHSTAGYGSQETGH